MKPALYFVAGAAGVVTGALSLVVLPPPAKEAPELKARCAEYKNQRLLSSRIAKATGDIACFYAYDPAKKEGK